MAVAGVASMSAVSVATASGESASGEDGEFDAGGFDIDVAGVEVSDVAEVAEPLSPPQPAITTKAAQAASGRRRRARKLNLCICFTRPRIRGKTTSRPLQPAKAARGQSERTCLMRAADVARRARRLTTRNCWRSSCALELRAGNPAIFGFESADRRLCVPALRQVCLSLEAVLYVRGCLHTSVGDRRHASGVFLASASIREEGQANQVNT